MAREITIGFATIKPGKGSSKHKKRRKKSKTGGQRNSKGKGRKSKIGGTSDNVLNEILATAQKNYAQAEANHKKANQLISERFNMTVADLVRKQQESETRMDSSATYLVPPLHEATWQEYLQKENKFLTPIDVQLKQTAKEFDNSLANIKESFEAWNKRKKNNKWFFDQVNKKQMEEIAIATIGLTHAMQQMAEGEDNEVFQKNFHGYVSSAREAEMAAVELIKLMNEQAANTTLPESSNNNNNLSGQGYTNYGQDVSARPTRRGVFQSLYDAETAGMGFSNVHGTTRVHYDINAPHIKPTVVQHSGLYYDAATLRNLSAGSNDGNSTLSSRSRSSSEREGRARVYNPMGRVPTPPLSPSSQEVRSITSRKSRSPMDLGGDEVLEGDRRHAFGENQGIMTLDPGYTEASAISGPHFTTAQQRQWQEEVRSQARQALINLGADQEREDEEENDVARLVSVRTNKQKLRRDDQTKGAKSKTEASLLASKRPESKSSASAFQRGQAVGRHRVITNMLQVPSEDELARQRQHQYLELPELLLDDTSIRTGSDGNLSMVRNYP